MSDERGEREALALGSGPDDRIEDGEPRARGARRRKALGELGKDDRKDAGLVEQGERHGRLLRREHEPQLRADPLLGDPCDVGRVIADRLERPRLDAEPELRRDPDGTQHPQRVLVEAGIGIADRPDDARAQVGEPVGRVDPSGPRCPAGSVPRRSR